MDAIVDVDLVSFPVRLDKIKTEAGRIIEGKRAVVREDTGGVVGLVSDKYRLVRNAEILTAVSQVSEEFGLKPSSVYSCRGGAVMFGKFFQENGKGTVEVKVGDIVRVGVEVFNSYDGSMPVGVMLIAERLRCKNGMVAPETITSFFAKHYPSLQLSEVRERLGSVLSHVGTMSTAWKNWAETQVGEDRVQDFFGKVFGHRKRSQLFVRYRQEREDGTVWGLYNFLTRHVTHELKSRKGHEADLRWTQWGIENDMTSEFYNYRWN